jgi:hypothetical protein
MKSMGIAVLLAGLLGLPLLAVLGWPPAARAQQAPLKSSRSSRSGVEGLVRGAQWTHRGQAYAVVPEVRAVLGGRQGEEPAAAFARAGVTGGPVLEQKGGFLLYKQAAAPRPSNASAPAALLATQADPRPVVLNLRTQKLAVVAGAIRAELNDVTAGPAVATDLGIALGREFPNRRVAFYTAPAGTDLLTLLARMRAHPRVAAADLELIEYVRTPR